MPISSLESLAYLCEFQISKIEAYVEIFVYILAVFWSLI